MRKTAFALALIAALPNTGAAAPKSGAHPGAGATAQGASPYDDDNKAPARVRPIVVDEMLRLSWVSKGDVLYDLGCGDSRVVTLAARWSGAHGVCIDNDEAAISATADRARRAGLARRVKFVTAVPERADLKTATVVSVTRPMPMPQSELRHKLLFELRPGSRIVIHDFDLGQEWKPDLVEQIEGSTINVWIVPASVHGRWSFRVRDDTAVLDLKQDFQKISGTVRMGEWEDPISTARLRGKHITFVARPDPARSPMKFDGFVDGDRIRGERDTGSSTAPWIAVKEPVGVAQD